MTFEEVERAKQALRKQLKTPERPEWLRGIGIGLDDRGYFIKVNVSKAGVSADIPSKFQGARVVVDAVGEIIALKG